MARKLSKARRGTSLVVRDYHLYSGGRHLKTYAGQVGDLRDHASAGKKLAYAQLRGDGWVSQIGGRTSAQKLEGFIMWREGPDGEAEQVGSIRVTSPQGERSAMSPPEGFQTRQRKANRGRSRDWIRREGKLGGPGYTDRPTRVRRRILSDGIPTYGYRSVLGSLQVLLRNRDIHSDTRRTIKSDIKWLKAKYGGPGSFGIRG